ncbi:MAG: VUT family protein [Coxiellaceae bacterium]|nr:MAG: VUT family protein [Coxiellaceae bacterium]
MELVLRYRYLPYLTVLLLVFSLIPLIFVHRLLHTPFGVIFVTALTAPFWYVIGDIITEVYGFKAFIRLFRWVLLCELIFLLLSYCLLNLKLWASYSLSLPYEIVFNSKFNITLIKLGFIYTAYAINAYLLDYWKKIFQGRYFWFRMMAAAAIGYLWVIAILMVFASDFLPYDHDIGFVSLALIFKLTMMGLVGTVARK